MPLARMLALSNSGMADTAVSSIIQGRDRIAAYSDQRLLAPAKSLRLVPELIRGCWRVCVLARGGPAWGGFKKAREAVVVMMMI